MERILKTHPILHTLELGGADKNIPVVGRFGKAIEAFVKLNNLWISNSISRRTKIKTYNSYVLSVLMYGSEWKGT